MTNDQGSRSPRPRGVRRRRPWRRGRTRARREPARLAVAAAALGVIGGLVEGPASAVGSRGGTSQPVWPGTTRSSVPSTAVPTTARRAAIASSTALGMPSQCEAWTSTSADLSRPGTSSRRPSQRTCSRRGARPAIASSSQVALGPVADDRQVPAGPARDHPLGRIEQVGQPLLRIQAADAQRQVGVFRHADRRARDRLGRVERRGVDPVGDDREPRRVEPADVAAERQHAARHADRAGAAARSSDRASGASASVARRRGCRPAPRPRPARPGRRQPRRQVGVKQVALDQLRPEPPQGGRQPRDRLDRVAAARHPGIRTAARRRG